MMIYMWKVPDSYPQKAVAVYDRELSPNYWDFMDGQRVTAPNKPFVFDVEVKVAEIEHYDCIGNNTALPLVGPHMQRLLNKYCPDDIQYLPAVIRCTDGMVKIYKAINITHCVNAIDYELSDYTTMKIDPDPEFIDGVKYLVFNSDSMGCHHLARDQKLGTYRVISQTLHDLIQAHNMTGIHLMTADEDNNLMNLIRGR